MNNELILFLKKRKRECMIPKVLVISNECFSSMSSNGRTLGNFFAGWPKENLAQFFLNGKPDTHYCDNFFRVSDRQALNAVLGRNDRGGKIKIESIKLDSTMVSVVKKKKTRNALTMLIRNAVWKIGAWENSGYWKWVQEVQPDIVLLQAGDCAFMYNLAVRTAERVNANLVIYNSEGYYYKNFDYFCGRGIAHALYPIFRRQLMKALEKAYNIASCAIYICDELKEQYAENFTIRSEVVYTGSEITYEPKTVKNSSFRTVYCGNLGLKRHESLIEIADVLQSISKNLYVDVYGKAPDNQVLEALNSCKGIRYHGLVPYEQVKYILRESDLLLYVESFDSFYQEDIKFGFSTKIADSLACGNSFLLYAPEHFACYQYLKKNKAAFTASNRLQLELVLKSIIDNPEERSKYRKAALALAEKNHNVEKNKKKFQKILQELKT